MRRVAPTPPSEFAAEHPGHHVYFQRSGGWLCRTCHHWRSPVRSYEISRILAGAPPDDLTMTERLTLVQIFDQRGIDGAPASATQIAPRIGACRRSVVRYRSWLRHLGPDWQPVMTP